VICRHNDFHFSVRPPSWICDDVIILHPVIDFHGLNIVLNFHVDWFVSFNTNHIYVPDRRQTDRQTDVVIA